MKAKKRKQKKIEVHCSLLPAAAKIDALISENLRLKQAVAIFRREGVLMKKALRGFNQFCIKPSCRCWACTTLEKLEE